MPLSTKMVGARTEAITHVVDARWLQSYAAGIGDFNPRYVEAIDSIELDIPGEYLFDLPQASP